MEQDHLSDILDSSKGQIDREQFVQGQLLQHFPAPAKAVESALTSTKSAAYRQSYLEIPKEVNNGCNEKGKASTKVIPNNSGLMVYPYCCSCRNPNKPELFSTLGDLFLHQTSLNEEHGNLADILSGLRRIRFCGSGRLSGRTREWLHQCDGADCFRCFFKDDLWEHQIQSRHGSFWEITASHTDTSIISVPYDIRVEVNITISSEMHILEDIGCIQHQEPRASIPISPERSQEKGNEMADVNLSQKPTINVSLAQGPETPDSPSNANDSVVCGGCQRILQSIRGLAQHQTAKGHGEFGISASQLLSGQTPRKLKQRKYKCDAIGCPTAPQEMKLNQLWDHQMGAKHGSFWRVAEEFKTRSQIEHKTPISGVNESEAIQSKQGFCVERNIAEGIRSQLPISEPRSADALYSTNDNPLGKLTFYAAHLKVSSVRFQCEVCLVKTGSLKKLFNHQRFLHGHFYSQSLWPTGKCPTKCDFIDCHESWGTKAAKKLWRHQLEESHGRLWQVAEKVWNAKGKEIWLSHLQMPHSDLVNIHNDSREELIDEATNGTYFDVVSVAGSGGEMKTFPETHFAPDETVPLRQPPLVFQCDDEHCAHNPQTLIKLLSHQRNKRHGELYRVLMTLCEEYDGNAWYRCDGSECVVGLHSNMRKLYQHQIHARHGSIWNLVVNLWPNAVGNNPFSQKQELATSRVTVPPRIESHERPAFGCACGQLYASKRQFKAHFIESHPELTFDNALPNTTQTIYECLQCPQQSPNRWRMLHHIKSAQYHGGKGIIAEVIINQESKSQVQRVDPPDVVPRVESFEAPSFSCPCGEIYLSKQKYEAHIGKCPRCPDPAIRKPNRDATLMMYQCLQCPQRSTNRWQMLQHIKTPNHSGQGLVAEIRPHQGPLSKYQCPVCAASFPVDIRRFKHMRAVHPVPQSSATMTGL